MGQRQGHVLTKQDGVIWRQLGACQKSAKLIQFGVCQESCGLWREKISGYEDVEPALSMQTQRLANPIEYLSTYAAFAFFEPAEGAAVNAGALGNPVLR